MNTGAWDIGAQAISSPIPMIGLAKAFFGRRAQKAAAGAQKARMMQGVHNAERAQAQFEQDAPIQEQALQQSLASRGVGTSSMQEQDTKNQLATHARQRAALAENLDVANRGMSAYKRQQKYAKRMGPLNFYEALIGRTAQAMQGALSPEALGQQNVARGVGSQVGSSVGESLSGGVSAWMDW